MITATVHTQRELLERLCAVLRDPRSALAFSDADWDLITRAMRSAGLLLRFEELLRRVGGTFKLPTVVQRAMDAETVRARHRHQMVLWELERVSGVLTAAGIEFVLLKGAAYVVEGFSFGARRLVSDVDLLVRRSQIERAEKALGDRGWLAEDLQPYDQRYYRQWSHELPPMRYPGCPLELDLHHAIVPPGGRCTPDSGELFAAARVGINGRFRVLAPEDMVLHVCLHLFIESDGLNRLRDLVDLQMLLEVFSSRPGFWGRVVERSLEFGAAGPLADGLSCLQRFLGVDVPAEPTLKLRRGRTLGQLSATGSMYGRCLAPPHPETGYDRVTLLVATALRIRANWLRFPRGIFIRHALEKPWRHLLGAQER